MDIFEENSLFSIRLLLFFFIFRKMFFLLLNIFLFNWFLFLFRIFINWLIVLPYRRLFLIFSFLLLLLVLLIFPLICPFWFINITWLNFRRIFFISCFLLGLSFWLSSCWLFNLLLLRFSYFQYFCLFSNFCLLTLDSFLLSFTNIKFFTQIINKIFESHFVFNSSKFWVLPSLKKIYVSSSRKKWSTTLVLSPQS